MYVVGPSRRDIFKGKAWNGREIRFIGTTVTYLQIIHEILASPTQCAVQVQKQQELRSCGDGGPHPPRRLKNNRASPCQPRMSIYVSKEMPLLQLHSGKSFFSRVESSGRFRQPRFAAVGSTAATGGQTQKKSKSSPPPRYPTPVVRIFLTTNVGCRDYLIILAVRHL